MEHGSAVAYGKTSSGRTMRQPGGRKSWSSRRVCWKGGGKLCRNTWIVPEGHAAAVEREGNEIPTSYSRGRGGHAIPGAGILSEDDQWNRPQACGPIHLYGRCNSYTKTGRQRLVIDRLRRRHNAGRFVRLPEYNQTYCRRTDTSHS